MGLISLAGAITMANDARQWRALQAGWPRPASGDRDRTDITTLPNKSGISGRDRETYFIVQEWLEPFKL